MEKESRLKALLNRQTKVAMQRNSKELALNLLEQALKDYPTKEFYYDCKEFFKSSQCLLYIKISGIDKDYFFSIVEAVKLTIPLEVLEMEIPKKYRKKLKNQK